MANRRKPIGAEEMEDENMMTQLVSRILGSILVILVAFGYTITLLKFAGIVT